MWLKLTYRCAVVQYFVGVSHMPIWLKCWCAIPIKPTRNRMDAYTLRTFIEKFCGQFQLDQDLNKDLIFLI